MPGVGTEMQEGQDLVLECEVIYHGYKAPTLDWIDANNLTIPSYDDSEDEIGLMRYARD